MIKIPAITIYQPWPVLLLLGVKGFETRTRPPPLKHLGQRIAIHAAKRPPNLHLATRVINAAEAALFRYRQPQAMALPRGAVIGTAVLAGAYRIGEEVISRAGPKFEVIGHWPGSAVIDTYQPIDLFGDFTPGRWAWLFTDLQFLPAPIPARGSQGWWYWEDA